MKKLLTILIIIFFSLMITNHGAFSDENEHEAAGLFDILEEDKERIIKEEFDRFRESDKEIRSCISFSNGHLKILPDERKGFFFGGRFWYESVVHSPVFEIEEIEDEHIINLRSRGSKIPVPTRHIMRPRWKYKVPADIDNSLIIDLAGSNANIELGGTYLKEVKISSRGGEGLVSFSKPVKNIVDEINIIASRARLLIKGYFNANARHMSLLLSSGKYYLDLSGCTNKLKDRSVFVRLNASSLDIRLQENIGYEIFTATLVGINAPDLIRDEFYHRTPDFSQAENRVRIEIRGMAGRVNVSYEN